MELRSLLRRATRLRPWGARTAVAGVRAPETLPPIDDASMNAVGSAASRGSDAPGLSERSIYVQLLENAWPLVTAMAGEILLGLVDTKLVTGLGTDALAGVGIATTLMWVCYALAMGLSRGVKVRVAFAIGEGRPGDASTYAAAGAMMAFVYGLGVFALGRDIGPVLRSLGIDAHAVPYARDFFAAVTFGAPGACAAMALVQHRQGIGDARTPMFVTLLGNMLNAGLGYCLIYGRLGLPALGVYGGGLATALVQSINFAVLLGLLLRDRTRPGVRLAYLSKATRQVLRVGLPTGMQFMGEILAFCTFSILLGSISAAESAANQIAIATIRASFLPGLAVGEAACVLVGQALGAGRFDDARRAVRAALHLAVVFMAACGVLFAVAGGGIARAFTPDPEVGRIVTRLLLLAAVFQVLDAVNIVYRCALRGAQDVRVPALLGIGIVWTTVPLAAYLLGRVAGWGAVGGWCGFVVETALGAAFFYMRFRRLSARFGAVQNAKA
jgi:multidrug resistance protein, MATE family